MNSPNRLAAKNTENRDKQLKYTVEIKEFNNEKNSFDNDCRNAVIRTYCL